MRTAYAAVLPGGHLTFIVLNKDAERDLELELDFANRAGAVESEALHAPALDSREAHISQGSKAGQLRDGKFTATVPHASGLRLTIR